MKLQNISRSRWRMLVWLSEHQPYSIKDLTKRLMLKQPTVTRLVDMAVDDGLIDKSNDARDGRQAVVTLTPAGEALVAELEGRARTMNDRLIERLGRKRASEFARQLRDVIACFEDDY
ncbi:MarR family winged helix-turn-helix transcriptional regulator [Hoeflea poritis]|uniref:MarR family transcriptional regulator n=1 Tax=Hoeflea poritis TaxID=2993659 RepID=A0ABT4VX37_9HYPH|nr:MarR family transcriptional regulator [Hoeflea poritis]MDA4848573.1 MarR family transcriptional regulator [Hoeflea poritis]